MNTQKFGEDYAKCRNEVNKIIDDLVCESLEAFDSYEDAKRAIRQLKFYFYGSVGEFILEESIVRITSIAMKRATKG